MKKVLRYLGWDGLVIVTVVIALAILFWGGIICNAISAEREIVVKGVPDTITDQECLEWISVLIERKHMAKIQQIPELKAAQKTAQTEIDLFRTKNGLAEKFVPAPQPEE